MTTNITTSNLKVNVLGFDEYDDISSKQNSELYVVKQDNADTDNAISSRTYADVGRDAVHYGPTAPTSQWAKIWVDTSDDPVLIQPASIDMNNLTATGITNVHKMIAPNFSAATSYSTSEGDTFSTSKSGWLYVIIGTSSAIELKKDSNSGVDLCTLVSSADNKLSDHLFLEKSTTVYVNIRSGTVTLVFYPCKESL